LSFVVLYGDTIVKRGRVEDKKPQRRKRRGRRRKALFPSCAVVRPGGFIFIRHGAVLPIQVFTHTDCFTVLVIEFAVQKETVFS
jgi:hypothetical protein